MIRVAINADDYGLSDGICRSVLELIDADAVSNTTIMIAAEDSGMRCARFGLENIEGRAGVHLQLSGGRPLSPVREVDTLVDTTGRFKQRDDIADGHPDQVRAEWRRQILAVADLLGTAPTHLDSHHGAHRHPGYAQVYLDLAEEFGLPVRGGVTPEFTRLMAERGVRGSHAIIRDWTGRDLGIADLRDRLARSAATREPHADLIEVVTHPGFDDAHLRQVSTLNSAREGDHRVLLDLARSDWLRENGFELVRYPDV
ncbi:carbohydrate deacetylase [Actinosynnema sp. CS-041913]|uniref:carbohydrate deacetylase n=1 Tax=Actinosynnema sp. CS-041913 TaxID=3239917 RepID=UPI003D91EB85